MLCYEIQSKFECLNLYVAKQRAHQNVRIRCDCFATELSIEGLCVGIGNIRILFRLATDKERRDVFVRMSVMFIHPWFSCVVHIVYPLNAKRARDEEFTMVHEANAADRILSTLTPSFISAVPNRQHDVQNLLHCLQS